MHRGYSLGSAHTTAPSLLWWNEFLQITVSGHFLLLDGGTECFFGRCEGSSADTQTPNDRDRLGCKSSPGMLEVCVVPSLYSLRTNLSFCSRPLLPSSGVQNGLCPALPGNSFPMPVPNSSPWGLSSSSADPLRVTVTLPDM